MSYWYYHHLFNTAPTIVVKTQDSFLPSAIGAFLGAFFAFIFGLITFFVTKKLERYWLHKKSAVEIEHILQQHLDQNASNKYLLQGAIKTLQKKHMTYTLLDLLRLPEGIDMRIGDLELLNKYQDYEEPAIKVNHSMTAWQGLNERLSQVVINNPDLPTGVINQNMTHLEEQAGDLIKFIDGLDEETQIFLAYITVYLRKDKHYWSKWWLRKKTNRTELVTDDEVKIELKKLQKSIEEISRKSRERIAKIMED